MKKQFDIYKPMKWEPSERREKNYPNETDPTYWDYIDITNEIMKYPRIINLASPQNKIIKINDRRIGTKSPTGKNN
jgi:hypothetical protein